MATSRRNRRSIGKAKVIEDLKEAHDRRDRERLEVARRVGLSAARAVHVRPAGRDLDSFKQILSNHISSKGFGILWAKTSLESYKDELHRLSTESHRSVWGQECCKLSYSPYKR